MTQTQRVWSRRPRVLVLSAALLAAAALSAAPTASAGHPVALIAGPVNPGGSAGANHYKMLVLAGEGGPALPAAGLPGKTKPGASTGASMWVLFIREANGTGAKVTIEQLYAFALPARVLKALGRGHGFDVGRALTGQVGYGVINMPHFARGHLKGIFQFSDVDGLSTALLRSLPARIVHGSLLTAIAGGHLPKTPETKTGFCPPAGYVALTGFRPDSSSGDEYMVLAARPALSKPVTILATDFLNAKATAPATELREIVVPAAPTTALTVQPPSREGNAVNTGGALLDMTSGFPYLSGDLSFGSEFSLPGSACISTEEGTVAAGPNANEGVVSPPIAQFDPGDPGSTEVHLATTPQTNGDVLMQGMLVTPPGG